MATPSKRTADQAFEESPKHLARSLKKQCQVRAAAGSSTPITNKSVKSGENSSALAMDANAAQTASQPNSTAGSAPIDTPFKKRENGSSKKLKKRQRRMTGMAMAHRYQLSEKETHAGPLIERKWKRDKYEHRNQTKIARSRDGADWGETVAGGGIFLDQDPILSLGDQYVILPTMFDIQIFSARTSLLVRSLSTESSHPITSCALLRSNPDHLLATTFVGEIIEWDWTTGKKVRQWTTRSNLIRVQVLPAEKDGSAMTGVLTLHQAPEGHCNLLRLTLDPNSNIPDDEVTLLRLGGMIFEIVVLEKGKLLIVYAGDQVLLGVQSKGSEYLWRQMTVTSKIATLDARIRPESSSLKRAQPNVDVVLGLKTGAILLYNDLLNKLIRKEKDTTAPEPIARRLHWHRYAVGSVKFSRDGNYLVSGGHETVLVIWQLDTNQQQYLPHLTSPILNIVVSRSGASYTMRMGDNSVVVLATADLLPTTSIHGLSTSQDPLRHVPIVVNPRKPDELLVVTSPEVANRPGFPVEAIASATMLQTFDMRSSRQVSRQALARNKATLVDVTSTGHRVSTPDVQHIAVSHDGQWLATVDEWKPPGHDMDPLCPGSIGNVIRSKRTETSLRFWTWWEEHQTWEMVTRIDEPHQAAKSCILDLAFNPVRLEFATAGKDGVLRTWRPMSRVRNGMAVRDQAGNELYTWVCYHVVPVEDTPPEYGLAAKSAAMAYSQDGSMIAASWSLFTQVSRQVHFLDTRAGTVRMSQPNLLSPGHVKLAFSGRYLLLFAEEFCIWDVVNTRMVFRVSLKSKNSSEDGGLVAVNSVDGTFALGFTSPNPRGPTLIAILRADAPEKLLHLSKVDSHIKALLAVPSSSGYIIIDGNARIRRLAASISNAEPSGLTFRAREKDMKGLNSIFGGPPMNSDTILDDAGAGGLRPEGQAGLAKSLEEIFSRQSTMAPMPPAKLLESVVALYAKSADARQA